MRISCRVRSVPRIYGWRPILAGHLMNTDLIMQLDKTRRSADDGATWTAEAAVGDGR
jgi:hypothetical protein